MPTQLQVLSPVESENPEITLSNPEGKVIVQILRNGRWRHPKAPNGELVVTDELIGELCQNFSELSGHLPMDEDHKDPLKKRAKSWITNLIQKPGKLYGEVEFADQQLKQDVLDKKIKYVSAEIFFGRKIPARGGQTGNILKAVDWTNLPFIQKMDPAMVVNLSECEELDLSENFKVKLKSAFDDLFASLSEEHRWSKFSWDQRIENLPNVGDENFSAALDRFDREAQAEFNTDRFTGSDLVALGEKWTSITDSIKSLRDSIDLNEEVEEPDDTKPGDTDDETDDPNLPSQCQSCAKLENNTCPFQGINVKIAAAGDGHCPQYISADVEPVSPSGGTTGEDPEEHTKMNENQSQDIELLKTQLVALSEKVNTNTLENEGLVTLTQAQSEQIESLKAQVAQANREKSQAVRRSFASRYIESGKLTPVAAEICLNILEVADGEVVTLNDEPQTIEGLLTKLCDELPVSVELGQRASATGGGNRDENPVELNQNRGGTDLEKLEPLIKERANALAIEAGKPGQGNAFYGAAARQIVSEKGV